MELLNKMFLKTEPRFHSQITPSLLSPLLFLSARLMLSPLSHGVIKHANFLSHTLSPPHQQECLPSSCASSLPSCQYAFKFSVWFHCKVRFPWRRLPGKAVATLSRVCLEGPPSPAHASLLSTHLALQETSCQPHCTALGSSFTNLCSDVLGLCCFPLHSCLP